MTDECVSNLLYHVHKLACAISEEGHHEWACSVFEFMVEERTKQRGGNHLDTLFHKMDLARAYEKVPEKLIDARNLYKEITESPELRDHPFLQRDMKKMMVALNRCNSRLESRQ